MHTDNKKKLSEIKFIRRQLANLHLKITELGQQIKIFSRNQKRKEDQKQIEKIQKQIREK